ncbi:hypothetical protein KL928_001341 [Ogataea angusta]|uniref:Uncharacterized protein n=1 Tax=Pichia angusta TaxID=870730 RepID=A0AAN6DJ32_PICAN|nr:uncharacterized protein KL928_001341 [Ogataea angusta]KAG7821257.1 hypothetical protein KL928_001341 [Ogataea angusta]
MEPSTKGFARHHSQAVLAHRPLSKRPSHRANLVRQNSSKKSQLYANRAHFASKSDLRAIFDSKESLHDVPPYMVSYTLSPSWTQYEHNPVLKYAVARTRVANRQLFLDPTDMSIKDYMTPQSVELPHHLNKSLQSLTKLGIDPQVKSLPKSGYQYNTPYKRLSTMAEITVSATK